MASQPSVFPRLATSGTRTAPSAGLESTGYANGDAPAAETFNHLFGVGSDWAEWLEQERAAHVARMDAFELSQKILAETQAAQSLRLAFSVPTKNIRDCTVKVNGNGSLAGILLVGDSGALYTRVLDGALTARTPGSGYSAAFKACLTTSNGIYVAVGANGEVQTSADGVSFTERLNTGGSDDFYCVASDGTNVLAGGQNGLLYYATSATGTYSVRTSPAGGSDAIQACHYGNGLWVITTFDGEIWTSATAANGSWTQRLALTGTSPHFLEGRISQGAFGWSALYLRDTDKIGHAYSTDGTTWTQSLSNDSFGDHANAWNVVLDNTFVCTDNVNAGTEFLTIGVFDALAVNPSLNGDCRTMYGVLQSDCRMFRLKRINDQIVALCHDGGTNSFIYFSAPFKTQ